MTAPLCSRCNQPLEVVGELNRVGGEIICWNCLVPNPNEQWQVTLRWAGEFPTPKEIAQLRAMAPAFQEQSAKELWQLLRNQSKVDLGTFYKPHLDQLMARNREHGFHLEVQSTLADRPDRSVIERLQLAIQRDDSEAVTALAAQLPRLDALTENGIDLLSLAIEAGSHSAAVALVESGIALSNPLSKVTPLQTALENGAIEMVEMLLDHPVDLNGQGTEEETYAIHLLCRYYRSAKLLARFLEQGARGDQADKDGDTPLSILQADLDEEGSDPETAAMIELLSAREP